MNERTTYDVRLLYVTLVLVAIGLVMVFSASQITAQGGPGSPFFILRQQAIRVAFGLCVFFILIRIPYHLFEKRAVHLLVVSMILLVAVLIWGKKVRGSTRWLSFSYFMIQPVEAAKICLVIFLAAKISSWRGRVKKFREGFLPLACVTAAMALLVALQPNIGNAAFIIGLSTVIMFIGGCRLVHLIPFWAGAAAIAAPLTYLFLPHVRDRIGAFLSGHADLLGGGYHVEQSLIALGSGFIYGCGPGGGHQKYSFLPDAHTDFIYSIIGEELGFVGTFLVLALFTVLFHRALRAARRSPSSFGFLLAFGFGFSIFAHAVINIAITLGLVPTAGLPLPFISYGGSCLVTSLAAVGIILNISAAGRSPARSTADRRSARRVYARRVRGKGRR